MTLVPEPDTSLVLAPEVVDAELVDDDPDADRLARRAELKARRERSLQVGQIDNGLLYAGSPMYYYCKYCGVQTEVKSETWFLTPPSEVCKDCQSLIELGWHDGVMPKFRKHR